MDKFHRKLFLTVEFRSKVFIWIWTQMTTQKSLVFGCYFNDIHMRKDNNLLKVSFGCDLNDIQMKIYCYFIDKKNFVSELAN